MQPVALRITPDRWPINVDAPLTLRWRSFWECGRARFSVFFDCHGGQYIQNSQLHPNVNILRLTVAYRKATTNSETQYATPEIRTDRSSQTLQNPLIAR